MLQIKDSNVTIMVTDMDRAIQFYENIGLTLKQRWDNHYAMISGPGITLGLHPASGATGSGALSIGFMVDKIDDAKAMLDSHHIAYKAEDDGKSGLYVYFTDPDGTILYFVEPRW